MDAALHGWTGRKDRPFFAWIHLYDAHSPTSRRSRFARSFAAGARPRLYDGEIAFADQQVGRCVSWLRERRTRPRRRSSSSRGPRRGTGQPWRRDAWLLRLRLRPSRAVHRHHAVRGVARCPSRLAGQPGRRLPDGARRRRRRLHSQRPRPLPSSADVPSRDAEGGLRPQRIDDSQPPVRMEPAPLLALAALQAHPGATAGAFRPRRGSGRTDERLRPASDRSPRDGPTSSIG